MGTDLTPLGPDEVVAIPVAERDDLVLVLGHELREGGSPVPRALVHAAVDKGGLLGGAAAARGLLDGSLVRLAPETVKQLRQGATFVKDSQGFALGTLKQAGGGRFSHSVRFVPGPANPAAAGLILQTIAVQYQLGQIQKALEVVDLKLDLLLQGQQHGVLSELVSTAERLTELQDKAEAGHELTAADEVKIRDYEDLCSRQARESALWLGQLRDVLAADALPLSTHRDRLKRLLEQHLAFWLRIFVQSRLSLARARTLRLYRATIAEPDEWARRLAAQVEADLTGIGSELVALTLELDAYLRRTGIASGLEQMSWLKKAEVRRRRRELWGLHEELRGCLEEVLPALPLSEEASLPDLPGPLERRDIEPPPMPERLADAPDLLKQQAQEAGRWLEDQRRDAADRARRPIVKRRGSRRAERTEDGAAPE